MLSRDVEKPLLLLLAGYNGVVAPYTFTPPNSLVSAGQAIKGDAGSSPAWITFAQDKPLAYVTDETTGGKLYKVQLSGNASSDAVVLSITDPGYSTGGDGAVSSCLLPTLADSGSHRVCVANYVSGSASFVSVDQAPTTAPPTVSFSRDPKGSIGPVKTRQDHSYAHQACAGPNHRWAYICDLGADIVWRLDARRAKPSGQVAARTVAGSGPRHIAFYTDQKTQRSFGYLACELTATVVAFEVKDKAGDAEDGVLAQIGEPQSALASGLSTGDPDTKGPHRSTSEIAVSPDGRFVYVGTRADPEEDHIAVFRRDMETGAVKYLDWYATGGRNLRHFSLSTDDDARWVAAAHQESKSVHILERDLESGALSKTSAHLDGVGPVAFAGFVPATWRNFL